MTSQEKRLNRIKIMESRLTKRYKSITINNRTCFPLEKGGIAAIAGIGGDWDALVLEYADTMELAEKGIFGEDGRLFYMAELNEEEMFTEIEKEIEAAGGALNRE